MTARVGAALGTRPTTPAALSTSTSARSPTALSPASAAAHISQMATVTTEGQARSTQFARTGPIAATAAPAPLPLRMCHLHP
eukprot:4003646-Prymnesium_polylepis.1